MGKKTNTDDIKKMPHYWVEKRICDQEKLKLIESSIIKELNLEEYKDYVKELENRINE